MDAPVSSEPGISGRWTARHVRGIAIGAAICSLVAMSVSVWLVWRSPSGSTVRSETDLDDLVPVLAHVATGLVLAWARPRNLLGWVLLGLGVFGAATITGEAYGTTAAREPWPAGDHGLWVATWAYVPPWLLPPTLLMLLFPTGHWPSRRWSWIGWASIVGVGSICLINALGPDAIDDFDVPATNPFLAPKLVTDVLSPLGLLVPAAMLVTLIGTPWRIAKASAPVRQQLAWMYTAVVIAMPLSFVAPEWLYTAATGLVPAAVVIGVLWYQLLGIDVVVRNTLVYAGLTGFVLAAFAAVSAVVISLADDGPIPTLASAVVIAVAVTPVRAFLQRSVDRFVYGDRRNPLSAVTRVGTQLTAAEETELLPVVLSAVADALRVPYSAIQTGDGDVIASHGDRPEHGTSTSAALRFGSESIGSLVVTTSTDALTSADRDLLHMLAPQVAAVAHAARLAAEVRVSKERVVAAVYDERHRLRRDLHDGLGPSLSGVALGIEAAQSLAPAASRQLELLDRLRVEVQAALAQIRRIIDDLRPAALEGTSLHAALRGHAASITDRTDLDIVVNVSGPTDELPPDVESAAYWIVLEALNNVVRHGQARTCVIVLARRDGDLTVEVSDDGRGLDPDQPRGVGLASMRQRAEALGGSFTITSGRGARLTAILPLQP